MSVKRALLLATVSVAVLTPTYASAQVVNEERRPIEPEPDINGVDLLTGGLSIAEPVINVPGASRLQLQVITHPSGAWSGSIFTKLEAVADLTGISPDDTTSIPDWPRIYTATTGKGTFQYVCYYPDWSGCSINATNDGSRIDFVGSEIIHTAKDGTKTIFPELTGGTYDTVNKGSSSAHTILYTNGEKISIQQYLLDGVTTTATSNTGYSVSHSNSQRTYSKNNVTIISVVGNQTTVTPYSYTRSYQDPVGRQSKTHFESYNGLCKLPITWVELGGVRTDYTYHTQPSEYGSAAVNTVIRNGRTWSYSNVYGGRTVTAPNLSTTSIASEATSYGTDNCYGAPAQSGHIISATTASGRQTQFGYGGPGDPGGLQVQTSATLPEGDKHLYAYDSRGNVVRTSQVGKSGGPARIIYEAGYSPDCFETSICNLPIWTKVEGGSQTDYTYDPTHGAMTTMIEPVGASGLRRKTWNEYIAHDTGNGVIWRLSASHLCNVHSNGENADCGSESDSITRFTYLENTFLPVMITQTNGTNSVNSTTTYTYNDLGHPTSITDPTGIVQFMRYDPVGRKTWEVSPSSVGGYAAKRFTYDAADRITRTDIGTVPDPSSNDIAISQTHVNDYDAEGNLVQSAALDGAGHKITNAQLSYDLLNRPICHVTRMNPVEFDSTPGACTLGPAGSFGSDRITQVTYDADGRPVKTVDGFGVMNGGIGDTTTELAYTGNGQVQWRQDGNGNRTAYTYDDFDRPWQTTFPDQSLEKVEYDSHGRPWKLTKRDNNHLVFGYDSAGLLTMTTYSNGEDAVVRAYDGKGRPTSITQGNNSLQFGYDQLGRLISSQSNGLSLNYLYDQAGRRTRITHPDGFYFNYSYDGTGKLHTIGENSGSTLITFAYDAFGRRTGISRLNGSTSIFDYDSIGRLSTLTHDMPATSGDLTLEFTYNPANQIATQEVSNDAYSWNGNYNIDRPYIVNNLNQYTNAGAAGLSYDLRGNLTQSGNLSYTYSLDNRLLLAAGSSLIYDPIGRLLRIQGATNQRLLYDGEALVAEYDDNGLLKRRYMHGSGNDEPLVWYETGDPNQRRWLFPDERSSTVGIALDTGIPIAFNSYDEYGIPSPNNLGRFQYTGQIWLPEIGMHYYKARVYSPTLGRFMQTDPIGYSDGMNVYSYVGNDPVNFNDPSGLEGSAMQDCRREAKVNASHEDKEIVVCGQRSTGSFAGLSGPMSFALAGIQAPSGPSTPPGNRPQNSRPVCPTPPASRPIGNRGVRWAAAADPMGMIAATQVRDVAHAATRARYGKSGTGDESDAYRHFYGSFGLAKVIGPIRATAILNANEVQNGGGKWDHVRMDTYNNWVGTAMSQDPRYRNMPTANVAAIALRNGCLRTAAR